MDFVSRALLARAGEQKILSQKAIETALDLSGLCPGRAEWRQFGVLAMRFAAVLSLAAGMVFLVAFNWQNLGLYARFAMVEGPLAAAVVFAWIKGTGEKTGKLSLMLAILLTGVLLALFGQTYQTGADIYELFLVWAALSLPWVLACRYTPCWALWLVLLNATVGLYAGSVGPATFRWLFENQWHWTPWSLPFLLNVLIYVVLVATSDVRWLRRSAMAVAMAFGTVAMVDRTFDHWIDAPVEPVLFWVACAGLAVYTYVRKDDLFNFAALALALIVVTTSYIGQAMMDARAGIGSLLFIGIYVILTSTAAVKAIAYIGRSWKVEVGAQ